MPEEMLVAKLKCGRCGYEWWPKNPTKHPKTCARCRSPYWDKPRWEKVGTMLIEIAPTALLPAPAQEEKKAIKRQPHGAD